MHRPAFNQQNVINQQRRVIQHSSQARPNVSNSASPSTNAASTQSLPTGWKKEELLKPSGLTAGKTEIYYISPNGRKVRSKQELQAVLGDKFDLSLFDWRSGKFMTAQQKNKRPGYPSDGPSLAKVHKSDHRLSLPTRRTAPVTQTGVSILKNHPDSKNSDVKHGPQEPPRQLFWEKRLEGGKASDPETGAPLKSLPLPKGIQSAGAPGYQPDQLVQSMVHSLFNRTNPVTGQQQNRGAFEKNPYLAVNIDQPMIKHYIVTDEDVRRQEARVKELRRKLEMAKKKLEPRYASERQG